MNGPPPATSAQLEQLHQTYCRLTGQNLSLRFDRERLWFEFHRAGFTLADLVQVVRYLQKEIRHTRRNVGALKLSNLLQLDRFEEDLNISRVRLTAEPPRPKPPASAPPPAPRPNKSADVNTPWNNCTTLKTSSAKGCSESAGQLRLHANLGSTRSSPITIPTGPLLPDYHDNLLPDFREAEHQSPSTNTDIATSLSVSAYIHQSGRRGFGWTRLPGPGAVGAERAQSV
jgi:hypothetical protein